MKAYMQSMVPSVPTSYVLFPSVLWGPRLRWWDLFPHL